MEYCLHNQCSTLSPLPFYDLLVVAKVCPFTTLFTTLYSMYTSMYMMENTSRLKQGQAPLLVIIHVLNSSPCSPLHGLLASCTQWHLYSHLVSYPDLRVLQSSQSCTQYTNYPCSDTTMFNITVFIRL